MFQIGHIVFQIVYTNASFSLITLYSIGCDSKIKIYLQLPFVQIPRPLDVYAKSWLHLGHFPTICHKIRLKYSNLYLHQVTPLVSINPDKNIKTINIQKKKLLCKMFPIHILNHALGILSRDKKEKTEGETPSVKAVFLKLKNTDTYLAFTGISVLPVAKSTALS